MFSLKRIGFWVLLMCILLAGWGWYRQVVDYPYRPDHLIRFHVMANSNSPADQALKLRVRDVLVQAMTPYFQQAGSVEEARAIARDKLDYMEQLARQTIRESGADYPVAVSLGRYHFPARTYHVAGAGPGAIHDLILPAGEYEAVRVVIGKGAGANWWCVLFPPLCFVDVQDNRQEPEVTREPAGDKKDLTPPEEGAAGKAEPAFKWSGPPAVATLAPPREASRDEGAVLKVNSPDGTTVEFRFRILDFLAGTRSWLDHLFHV
ncbi:stage II sporulation protein R [Desulfofundulus australicus DSM 11792]|uniref:Stage II sporulation protein R n=1 Tax=Desulfofundulus australicus DSM 11792 TaxID=1121425 RepID=A0A1M5A212_9FIRM|nr:stage II sporulation protein R [Desulfofundulus australicus]SHF24323.1 stage II sporulation protein R [Desulfofundulus australicus DSM 11792]